MLYVKKTSSTVIDSYPSIDARITVRLMATLMPECSTAMSAIVEMTDRMRVMRHQTRIAIGPALAAAVKGVVAAAG